MNARTRLMSAARLRSRLLALACVAGLAALAFSSLDTRAEGKHYVCPPCSSPCDARVFDKPGTCPKCGMALVEQGSIPTGPPHKKVAILIFNGVEIIDYTGPWEMFGAAGFDAFTVALEKQPVQTAMGMTVVPDYTFADAPSADVVLVPGGGVKGARGNAATLDWVRKASSRAERTLSVCNGAFILASAGLLDGLHATTTAHNIAPMRKEFPKVTVVDDARVVDNGRIITAGGLTAGIDGALHVISLMQGNGTAQEVALSEEYDWHPDGGFLRASLADMEIPNVDMDGMGDFRVISTRGSSQQWEMVIRGSSKLSAGDLMNRIGGELETKGNWKQAGMIPAGSTEGVKSAWGFVGRDGKPWNAELTIEPAPGQDHSYTAKLNLARKS